ncbi:MAG: hypothetical protein ABI411_05930 [Tahibacter sp.]
MQRNRRARAPRRILLAVLATSMGHAGWGGSAQATHCRRDNYSQMDAQERFGQAEAVFVGTLEKVEDLAEPPANRSQEGELERLVVSIDTEPTQMGTFVVLRSFKGRLERRVRIRINAGLPIQRRYLIYARSERGERRADGSCAPDMVRVPEDSTEHLKFLKALKAAGSGGDVYISAMREDYSSLEPVTLEFAGNQGGFLIRTEDSRGVRASGIAAGTYRLVTAAPTGYEYRCSPDPDCSALVLRDRGLVNWSVVLHPLSRLDIKAVDATGIPRDVHAQFDLYDASTLERIGPLPLTSFGYLGHASAEIAASAAIAPGRYVIALVIAEVDSAPNGGRMTKRDSVFSEGAESVNAALPVQINPGDNRWTFTLPIALQPIAARVQWLGKEEAFSPYSAAQWSLRTGNSVGEFPGNINFADFIHQPDLSNPPTLWVIPGQSWHLFTYRFRVEGADQYGLVIAPRTDSTLRLHVSKATDE